MLKKLKVKFVLVTLSIILVMLTVILGLICFFTKADLENRSYTVLQLVSQEAVQPGGIRVPIKNIQQPYFVIYLDKNNTIRSVGYTNYDLSDEAFLRDVIENIEKTEKEEGVLREYALMYNVHVNMNTRIYSFVEISAYNATLTALVESCLLIGAVSAVIFLLLSIFLARWMVRPVEKAWQQQQQFVSDASHELKTPLTVIMNNAELMQNCDDDQSKKRFTDGILTMSVQMRGLVEGMLELARADNGQIKKSFTKLDMSRLVSDAILPFEPVFYERDLELKNNIQDGIVLNGSPQYLNQLVDILLDNAQKYSAPGIVNIQLYKNGKKCTLTVSNPGQPIPEEEQKHIFERFYRADKVRGRSGSFGLGLAIAKSIAEEHRGSIWVVSNETGNCFFVEFPTI